MKKPIWPTKFVQSLPPRMSFIPGAPETPPTIRHIISQHMTIREVSQLTLFAKRAQDFIVAKQPQMSLRVENHYDESPVEHGEPPRLRARTITTPPDDEMAAKGLRLRHLMLDKEPATFLRVRNTVSSLFHKAGIDTTKKPLEQFKYSWRVEELKLFYGCPVNGDELIATWFNAEMFHGSEECLEKWTELEMLYGPHVRAWLMLAIGLKHTAAMSFRDFLLFETDIYAQE